MQVLANIQMQRPIGLLKKKHKSFYYFFFELSFYTYECVQEIVAFIQQLVPTRPELAIICGSGLGGLADLIVDKIVIPYSEIPHFPRSTG